MVTPSSTWCRTDTTETGWVGGSSQIRWRSFSEPMDSPASLLGREPRPCTKVSHQHRNDMLSLSCTAFFVLLCYMFKIWVDILVFKYIIKQDCISAVQCSKYPDISLSTFGWIHVYILTMFKLTFLLASCRILELWGCHQAFRVPGCDHRWPFLLLLLLPAQHGGPLCRDRCQQPQKEPPVGHWKPATVRQCAGRRGGGSERQRHQAPGSVPHEPAIEVLGVSIFLFEEMSWGNESLSLCSSRHWTMREIKTKSF